MKSIILFTLTLTVCLNLFSQDSIFYVQPANICTPGSKTLTASPSPSGATYQWKLNGVAITGANSNTYAATLAGKYIVTVNAKDYKELNLTASVSPVADFSSSTDNVCSNTAITFTNNSTGANSYLWDFGDANSGGANSSSQQSPSHTFVGSYGDGTQSFNVILTVKTNTGCIHSKSVAVKTKQIPDASLFDYTSKIPFTNCLSATFTLTVDNTSTTTSTNSNYQINWGDGTPNYTSPNMPLTGTNHAYNSQGYKILTFTVTGKNNCIESKNYSVYNGSNPQVPFTNPGASIGKCVPFLFSLTSSPTSNPIGTKYIFSKNDGTGNEVFDDVPVTYSHSFLNSSCGATGGITPNTFFINVRADNPCGHSDLTIQPITTATKPKADFQISPDTLICEKTTVTITNSSKVGVYVDNDGVCDTTTLNNWLISPNSGWNIVSGSLGLANPTNNPTTWGSKFLQIRFDTPGSYLVKIIVRKDCGNDTLTKTICVNPTPTASFSLNQNAGCTQLNVNATGTTNTPTCGTNKFIYSVTYQPTAGCSPTTGTWSFTNGTNANSQNPKFQFNDPGTYTISLRVEAPGGTCFVNATPQTVTVKAKPITSINAIASICQSGIISPTAVASCYTNNATYTWNFPGGTPATANSLNPGAVSYSTTGNKSITLDVTNECGTATANQSFTVNTVTPSNAGPAQNLCGGTVTMAASTPTSGTGNWTRVSGPNFPSINSPSSPTTTITGLITGSYVFRWTIVNGNCSSSSDATITIAAGPSTSNAGPDQSLCLANSVTLAGNNPTTGNGQWTYVSGPTGYTITDATKNNTTVTGLIPGVYVFRWTISFSNCTPSTDDVQITISSTPTTADAGADQAICSSNTTLTGNTPLTGTALWTKVSGTGGIINTPNNAVTTVVGLIAGTYVFRYTISNGGCTPSSKDVTVVVTGTAALADAGLDQTACGASNVTLAGNNPSPGTGLWTYVSGPLGSNISAPASPASQVTGLLPGVYVFKWTISNGTCSSTSDDVQITINENVTVANAGPGQSKCGTSAVMAANTPTVGTGAWSYVSGSTGYVIATPGSPTTTINGLTPGAYVFKWTITNGSCSSSSNVSIDIASGPSQANAGTDQALCLAKDATLTGNTPLVGTGIWSIVSGPGSPVIANSNSATTSVTGLETGIYTFRYTVSFSTCTPSTNDVVISVFENPSVSVTGPDQVICASGVSLSANNPSVGSGLWTFVNGPNTPVISAPTNNSTTAAGLIPGTYNFKWTISNGACPANSNTVKITVSDAASTANAGPDQTLCKPDFFTMSGNDPGNGTGNWILLNGPTNPNIANPNSPITKVAPVIPGIYNFRWTVSNGICPATNDDVKITILDGLQNHIDTSTQTICSGQSATVAGQTPTGGSGTYTYQWQQSTTGSNFTDIAGETNANITVSPLQPTWYRRYVKSLPCENASDTVKIEVLAGISNNTIGQSQAICINTAANVITGQTPAGGGGNFKFNWEKSIDAGTTWQKINGESAADYNPGILTATTWYRRVVATQLCNGPQGAASNIVIITVNPDAKALFEPLKTLSCAPFSIDASTVNQTPFSDRNGSFEWYANNNRIGSGSFPGYSIATPGDSVLIKLVAISKFGCKNDSMQLWFYSPVNPKPSFTLSDTVGCGPITITIKNTTPDAGNYSFIWDFGNGQTSTDSQPAQVVFATNPTYGDTVYTVTLKATGGCDTISSVQYIRVKSKPKSLFTPSSALGCSPMTVTFTNTSRGSNASFTWDFGDGSPQQQAVDSTIKHTFYTGVLDTFFVKLFGQNDCGIDTQQYAIVVNPNAIKLNVAVNGNQLNGCAPHSVLFVNNTRGANLFRWNFGDGSPELTTTKGVDSVLHTYTQTGNYTVTLFATNSCSDTSTNLNIIVETNPVVAFTATPQVLCVGQPVTINNTSESGLAWAWRFGDGSTSNVLNPVKTYSQPGNYRFVLKGTKSFAQGFGCTDSAFADIVIKDTIPGNFTVDSSGSCAPMNVAFKNQNRPSVNTVWDFGDGSFGKGDSVNHIYNLQGNYLAVMVAQAAGGCRYRDEKTIVVNGPSGELRYQGGYVCPPNTVQFEVISNNTSVYRFYFGNGDSLVTTSPVITYTYKKPGTYLPSVVLVTGNCSRLIKGVDSVKIETINAGFKSGAVLSCGSTTVNFADTSAAYYALNKWEWSFGDGTSSLLRNPVKAFTTAGTYNVQLRITSTSGCTSQVTVPVVLEVRNKPVSQISNSPLLCTSNQIVFTANVVSADSIAAHSWNFGNGATATGSMVAYTYTNAGSYTVTLISRTAFGCADTVRKLITINQSPLVKASADIRLCLGQSAQLNASGAPQMQWSPAQGLNCTSCANPVAKPDVTTLYTVTGTNAIGCPNTDSILVEAIQPLTISVNANDTICIGQSSQLFAAGAATYRWNPTVGLNAGNVPNPIATPLTTTAYTVVGFDAYNCFTDTAFVTVAVGQYPTVNLGTGALVVAGTAVQLNPALTNGPFKTYTWTPTTQLSCTNCPNPIATINNNITYQLIAENIYGCSGSDTISYQVLCSKDDQVYIPNAFSPDGDGINDVFMVQGKGILVDYFRVFNRWGQVVFDGGSNYRPNEPAFGWNGKINGKPATQDVYVYTVQVRCTAGGTFTYKGNVSLLYMR